MPHPFLSDEWIAEARRIRAEHDTPAVPEVVRINQVVLDVPFGTGRIDAHLDTSSGSLELELGHLDAPDATITIDYETAKSIFVGGDPQAAMQAFMSGRIKVDGDLTKLLVLAQAAAPGAGEALVVQQKLMAITA